MLAPLNSTMIAVALPSIMDAFQADVSSAGWLATGYLITMASLQPVTGKIGDRLGRRWLILGAPPAGRHRAPALTRVQLQSIIAISARYSSQLITVLFPPPARHVSIPGPPSMKSLPLPAVIVSSPPPACTVL